MAYGFNDNTYECLRNLQHYDVFDECKISWSKGDQVGSAIVNAIIVDVNDRADVNNLEGQAYIDKMVELGYVKVV